ncbi:MAG: ferritin family protein [Candidatus Thermoplasmatota archaeon]|jgi:rubrerythrin|nr:ferritin family protein [Candidatus Thermoplasmatota archaeon]
MDLKKYTLEDLLLAAMKSEIESYTVYTAIAKQVKNGLLKDKFKFLAQEEQKHRGFIEQVYKAKFPKKKITLPENTPVPFPPLITPDEDTPLGTILKSAMTAEQAAHDFYQALSQQFSKNDSSIRNTLQYFADMELQHYKILEIEKESMDRFEQADIYWDMVHVGP